MAVRSKKVRKSRHEDRHAKQGKQAATASQRGREAGSQVEETRGIQAGRSKQSSGGRMRHAG